MWLHLWHLQCIVNCSYPIGKIPFREALGPMITGVKQAAAIRRGRETPVSKTQFPISWNRLCSPTHKLRDPQGSM